MYLQNVVLPAGDGGTQQQLLQDILSGARRELDAMGASIVGGHTIVGPRLEIGFTVIGKPVGQFLIRKVNLVAGDRLYLTKPLGIGVLLAAQARSLCQAADFESLLETMLCRQHEYARIAIECDIRAGTDVTGFGLAGHLMEMLESSDLSAELRLDHVPMLSGVRELLDLGIASSLSPDNQHIESKLSVDASLRPSANYQVLFDPQTCGGLLLGASLDKSQKLRKALAAANLPMPAFIGQVHAKNCSRTTADGSMIVTLNHNETRKRLRVW